MSAVITMQAVPSVACGDWDTINQHLLEPRGDWSQLRSVLLHLVCGREDFEGGQVSRLEEVLLNHFYADPPFRVGFGEVLQLVRAELEQWPEPVRYLVEYALLHPTDSPDTRLGLNAFPISLDGLRKVAPRASTPPPAPKRAISNVYRSGANNTLGRHEDLR
jgi:hypothetical protein